MLHTFTQGNTEYIQEDYVHSANSLFHFMKRSEYLTAALQKRALCPRYCNEDVAYLNIKNGEDAFDDVSILQKCFCDIPLSNVIKTFPITLTDNNNLTDEQKKAVPKELSHPELYGKYALAFTKKWGEKSKLQAMHYLNPEAICTENYSETLRSVFAEEDVSDIVADTLLDWICFFKPLRGTMKRIQPVDDESKETFEIEIFKNFHDEHEWRFVPSKAVINGQAMQCVIANKHILHSEDMINRMNKRLENLNYKQTWLPFQYDDIRYIIVPDNQSRIETINTISALDDSLFMDGDESLQRSILISKILVLDDIVKDF